MLHTTRLGVRLGAALPPAVARFSTEVVSNVDFLNAVLHPKLRSSWKEPEGVPPFWKNASPRALAVREPPLPEGLGCVHSATAYSKALSTILDKAFTLTQFGSLAGPPDDAEGLAAAGRASFLAGAAQVGEGLREVFVGEARPASAQLLDGVIAVNCIVNMPPVLKAFAAVRTMLGLSKVPKVDDPEAPMASMLWPALGMVHKSGDLLMWELLADEGIEDPHDEFYVIDQLPTSKVVIQARVLVKFSSEGEGGESWDDQVVLTFESKFEMGCLSKHLDRDEMQKLLLLAPPRVMGKWRVVDVNNSLAPMAPTFYPEVSKALQLATAPFVSGGQE